MPAQSIVDEKGGRTVDDVADNQGRNPLSAQVLYESSKAPRARGPLQPRLHPEIPVVTRPIWGIPEDEVTARIDFWDTERHCRNQDQDGSISFSRINMETKNQQTLPNHYARRLAETKAMDMDAMSNEALRAKAKEFRERLLKAKARKTASGGAT